MQPPFAVVVRVVDAVTGRALANADVTDLRTGTARLADERGEVRLTGVTAVGGRVRVRQIGYQPAERALAGRTSGAAGAVDTVAVRLARVAFRLPGVVTAAAATCPAATDTTAADSARRALTADVLLQIRTAAERYDSFQRAYPFRVRIERRSAEVRRDGTAPRIRVSRESGESDRYAERYEAGAVVRRERGGVSVPVLFVTALADPAFLARHCFAVGGVESLGVSRVLRLDFAPAPGVREPDWAGAALVDSATSELRRIEFRLANLGPRDEPARMEGYTTFTSPSPYVVLPESTMAGWWRAPLADRARCAWGPPDALQLLRVDSLEYRKARPPGLRDSTRP